MTPTQIHNLVKAAVEAVSDDRAGVGDETVKFLFGRASDIWLKNLEAGNVENLVGGGVVHMEFQQFTSVPVENDTVAYPVRLIFSKSHSVGDDLTEDLLPYQTEMYSLKNDVIAKLRVNTETNLSAANIALLKKLGVDEQEFQFFVYGNNVTTGVICDIVVTTKFCRN